MTDFDDDPFTVHPHEDGKGFYVYSGLNIDGTGEVEVMISIRTEELGMPACETETLKSLAAATLANAGRIAWPNIVPPIEDMEEDYASS